MTIQNRVVACKAVASPLCHEMEGAVMFNLEKRNKMLQSLKYQSGVLG